MPWLGRREHNQSPLHLRSVLCPIQQGSYMRGTTNNKHIVFLHCNIYKQNRQIKQDMSTAGEFRRLRIGVDVGGTTPTALFLIHLP